MLKETTYWMETTPRGFRLAAKGYDMQPREGCQVKAKEEKY
jgi:hypothetical protein